MYWPFDRPMETHQTVVDGFLYRRERRHDSEEIFGLPAVGQPWEPTMLEENVGLENDTENNENGVKL